MFINEVLDLTTDTQNQLFSALQDIQFLRLGGSQYVELDVRVIVTTSGNPQKAVSEGLFREDLYYHLNVIPIEVPPLRQRKQDLPELIAMFLQDMASRTNSPTPEVTQEALQWLNDYHWPGNVRQLQNIVQRLMILNRESEIDLEHVKRALGDDANIEKEPSNDGVPDYFGHDMRAAKESFEKSYLTHHLKTVDGNVSALAKKVGLERTHLYRKLKSLGLNSKGEAS